MPVTMATHLVIAETADDMFGIDCTIELKIIHSQSVDLETVMREAVQALSTKRQFKGEAYDLSVPTFEDARVQFPPYDLNL